MKRLALFGALLGSSVLFLAAQSPYPNFEFVESVPVETSLDSPSIRDTLPVWLEMFEKARKSIDIEQMYICNQAGEPLEKVIHSIVKAARRGVKVRIITERKFCEVYPETIGVLSRTENVQVRNIHFSDLKGEGVQHAKFFIVDQEEVFVGSQNFDWRSLKHVRELGVRVRHKETAKAFGDIFSLDWKLCNATHPDAVLRALPSHFYKLPFSLHEKNHEKVEFYPVWAPKEFSHDPRLWSLQAILRLIDKSSSRICINLLTYSPVAGNQYWPELDVALRNAAVRGVKVQLIVADWCKSRPKIDHLKSLALIPNLEIKLSTLPEHSGGFIPYARVTHSKFMAVDEEYCWIGCSNWEKNYFYTSRDMGLVIKNKRTNRLLQSVFEKDWESPYTYFIRPEVEYTPPRIGK